MSGHCGHGLSRTSPDPLAPPTGPARGGAGPAQGGLEPLRAGAPAEREKAWNAFYEQYFRLVYTIVASSGVPFGEVEDLTQKVFLVVHRQVDDVDVARVVPWLRGIALRVVQEHRRWRRVRRAKAWLTRLVFEEEERQRSETPERAVQKAQSVDLVHTVLQRLSPKLRDVLVLTELQELKPQEASDLLGVPVNTVRSRRRLAKEEFARELARLGTGAHTEG